MHSCCVVGCSNQQGKDSALTFYRIPVRHYGRQGLEAMVHSCCVVGCSTANCQGRDERSFYRIPKVIDGQGLQMKELLAKRRNTKLFSINRKDWIPGNGAHVSVFCTLC